MSRWRGQVARLGGSSAALALVVFIGAGSCAPQGSLGDPGIATPPAPSAEPPQLYSRERETARGFERVQEIERLERVSVIRFDTNHWGGASGGFAFGLSCLGELSSERGYSHFVVLDECARRLGVAPELGNDWQLVIGFVNDPDADPHAAFTDYDLSKRDCRAWPADGGAAQTLPAMGSNLWEVFTRPHWNFGGRAADGPDDKDWPQLCDDA